MTTIKATDGFIRSPEVPGTVLNTDTEALKQYKLQKAKAAELAMIKKDVKEMKDKFQSIESMLQQILSKV